MQAKPGMMGGCDLDTGRPDPEPVAVVVFGASGDLAHRKVIPALWDLFAGGGLHPESRIIGVARRAFSDSDFRVELKDSVARRARTELSEAGWRDFEAKLSYLQGDLDQASTYAQLARLLEAPGQAANRLFYLAVSPDQFGPVAEGLAAAGLGSADREAREGEPYRRLVVEKPFGRDRASARELSHRLNACFAERDIFRIDHYLGKETVQNLLYLRFANSIFEPLWNRQYIERVEIDVLETGGIGSRGGYYDHAGASRDMIQNHLIQLLCLSLMEPPPSLDPEAIRDEKVKVLKSIPSYSPGDFLARSRRAQYLAGTGAGGEAIPDYHAEAKVDPASRTETFAALRLEVDNWRFAGVPVILRTGKALDRQASEIRVVFRRPPETLFAGLCADRLPTNVIVIRIQPEEGIWLDINTKEPGRASLAPKSLRFSYREGEGGALPEAYERLLADAFQGDSTLFIRADEAEEAWRIVDGLEAAWASPAALAPARYPAGSSPDLDVLRLDSL